MHRIPARARAADQQPFEQHHLSGHAEDEARPDQRRREIEERPAPD